MVIERLYLLHFRGNKYVCISALDVCGITLCVQSFFLQNFDQPHDAHAANLIFGFLDPFYLLVLCMI